MPKTWTGSEERQLLDLREHDKVSWYQIANKLSRTQSSRQQRYAKLREARATNLVTWTPSLEESLIEAKSRDLSNQDIATELDIPLKAVSGKWNELKSEGRVPEELLGEPQHKEAVPWTHEEDVQILETWDDIVDDREIRDKAELENRSIKEVVERRVWLVNHDPSGLYRRMLAMRR